MARRKSALSILFGGSRRRSRSRGFFGTLFEGQRRTAKKNVPGSKRRYKTPDWKM